MPLLFNENVIAKYSETTKSIYLKLENNKQQNQQLTTLRDWLLPMLMNGQVTVKEAEEKLSSSAERSRSMAAEPRVEYEKN
jgi:type I restriction enzyme S subunit